MDQQIQLYKLFTSNKSYENTKEDLDVILDNGGDLHNPIGKNGECALHILGMSVCNRINRYIQKDGKTYLNFEEEYMNKDVLKKCRLLLSLDCDINALDSSGETLLDCICKSYTRNLSDKDMVIKFVLESGGKCNMISVNDELISSIDYGYNKLYVDKYYYELVSFLEFYNSLYDYILYSSIHSFKYIIINKRHDLLKELKALDNSFHLLKDPTYYINLFKSLFKLKYTNDTSETTLQFSEDCDYYNNLQHLIAYKDHKYKIRYIDNSRSEKFIKMFVDSFKLWSPTTHYIKKYNFKCVVELILNIKNRFKNQEKEAYYLPYEIWFILITYIE